MEVFFAILLKVVVIFIGSGIICLFACLVGIQISSIPQLIFEYEKNEREKEKVRLGDRKPLARGSAFYKLQLPTNKSLEVFSSPKGMKIASRW